MNRIKELRKQKGLTQAKLAQTLSISQANLSGWELGKWQPDQDALIKMAQYFGVTVDCLLGLSQNSSFEDSALQKHPTVGITEEDRVAGADEIMTVSVSANLYDWIELGENIFEEKGEEFFESLKKILREVVKKR